MFDKLKRCAIHLIICNTSSCIHLTDALPLALFPSIAFLVQSQSRSDSLSGRCTMLKGQVTQHRQADLGGAYSAAAAVGPSAPAAAAFVAGIPPGSSPTSQPNSSVNQPLLLSVTGIGTGKAVSEVRPKSSASMSIVAGPVAASSGSSLGTSTQASRPSSSSSASRKRAPPSLIPRAPTTLLRVLSPQPSGAAASHSSGGQGSGQNAATAAASGPSSASTSSPVSTPSTRIRRPLTQKLEYYPRPPSPVPTASPVVGSPASNSSGSSAPSGYRRTQSPSSMYSQPLRQPSQRAEPQSNRPQSPSTPNGNGIGPSNPYSAPAQPKPLSKLSGAPGSLTSSVTSPTSITTGSSRSASYSSSSISSSVPLANPDGPVPASLSIPKLTLVTPARQSEMRRLASSGSPQTGATDLLQPATDKRVPVQIQNQPRLLHSYSKTTLLATPTTKQSPQTNPLSLPPLTPLDRQDDTKGQTIESGIQNGLAPPKAALPSGASTQDAQSGAHQSVLLSRTLSEASDTEVHIPSASSPDFTATIELEKSQDFSQTSDPASPLEDTDTNMSLSISIDQSQRYETHCAIATAVEHDSSSSEDTLLLYNAPEVSAVHRLLEKSDEEIVSLLKNPEALRQQLNIPVRPASTPPESERSFKERRLNHIPTNLAASSSHKGDSLNSGLLRVKAAMLQSPNGLSTDDVVYLLGIDMSSLNSPSCSPSALSSDKQSPAAPGMAAKRPATKRAKRQPQWQVKPRPPKPLAERDKDNRLRIIALQREYAYLSSVGLGEVFQGEAARKAAIACRQAYDQRLQQERTIERLINFHNNHRYFSDCFYNKAIAPIGSGSSNHSDNSNSGLTSSPPRLRVSPPSPRAKSGLGDAHLTSPNREAATRFLQQQHQLGAASQEKDDTAAGEASNARVVFLLSSPPRSTRGRSGSPESGRLPSPAADKQRQSANALPPSGIPSPEPLLTPDELEEEREIQQQQISEILSNSVAGPALPAAIIHRVRQNIAAATQAQQMQTNHILHRFSSIEVESVARSLCESTKGSTLASGPQHSPHEAFELQPWHKLLLTSDQVSSRLSEQHAQAKAKMPAPPKREFIGSIRLHYASGVVQLLNPGSVRKYGRSLTSTFFPSSPYVSEFDAATIWVRILRYLPPRDIAAAARTCIALALLAATSPLWQHAARRQYPTAILSSSRQVQPKTPRDASGRKDDHASTQPEAEVSASPVPRSVGPRTPNDCLVWISVHSMGSQVRRFPVAAIIPAGLMRRHLSALGKLMRGAFSYNAVLLHPRSVTAATLTPVGVATGCEGGSAVASSVRFWPGKVFGSCSSARLVCRDAKEHIQVCAGMWAISQVRVSNPSPYHNDQPNLAHSHPITGMVYAGNGVLATTSLDYSLKLWNLLDASHSQTLRGHSGPITCLATWASTGPAIGLALDQIISEALELEPLQGDGDTAPRESTARSLLDMQTLRLVSASTVRDGDERPRDRLGFAALGVAVDPYVNPKQLLVTGSEDGTVRVWAQGKSSALAVLTPPNSPFYSMFAAAPNANGLSSSASMSLTGYSPLSSMATTFGSWPTWASPVIPMISSHGGAISPWDPWNPPLPVLMHGPTALQSLPSPEKPVNSSAASGASCGNQSQPSSTTSMSGAASGLNAQISVSFTSSSPTGGPQLPKITALAVRDVHVCRDAFAIEAKLQQALEAKLGCENDQDDQSKPTSAKRAITFEDLGPNLQKSRANEDQDNDSPSQDLTKTGSKLPPANRLPPLSPGVAKSKTLASGEATTASRPSLKKVTRVNISPDLLTFNNMNLIACGDETGRVTVFDVNTLSTVTSFLAIPSNASISTARSPSIKGLVFAPATEPPALLAYGTSFASLFDLRVPCAASMVANTPSLTQAMSSAVRVRLMSSAGATTSQSAYLSSPYFTDDAFEGLASHVLCSATLPTGVIEGDLATELTPLPSFAAATDKSVIRLGGVTGTVTKAIFGSSRGSRFRYVSTPYA